MFDLEEERQTRRGAHMQPKVETVRDRRGCIGVNFSPLQYRLRLIVRSVTHAIMLFADAYCARIWITVGRQDLSDQVEVLQKAQIGQEIAVYVVKIIVPILLNNATFGEVMHSAAIDETTESSEIGRVSDDPHVCGPLQGKGFDKSSTYHAHIHLWLACCKCVVDRLNLPSTRALPSLVQACH
ncbi:uncharacterized protein BDR25DRAFT_362725 [Lindgomyces ingoldianus]|uniref:Uncharacterized protein n=1 Tax=Lindgomyces ingoldianus TaxID=673940 RepID=A0ACB6QAZ9_9PLEO|nr:uncharacterized protein BDR25DRAFT_362725 [Lindgomyces ingoldianus]KAF2463557.1 hypothetical protein BDR25DRAFT_362725 [Lindgomyces ingoldianus]